MKLHDKKARDNLYEDQFQDILLQLNIKKCHKI